MNKKILLVEDEEFVSNAYQFFLSQAGFMVLAANDGKQALKQAELFEPDLILLDLLIPGLTGFEVLEKLKQKEATKNIPVVVVSNLSHEGDMERCYKLGAVDYLIKSNFFMKDVVARIEKHL